MRRYLGAILLLVALLGTSSYSSNAHACDKWKSEWFSLVHQGGKYVKLHREFVSGRISKGDFIRKSEKIVAKVSGLRSYVEHTESCAGEKFAKRKRRFLVVANAFVLAARAREFYEIVEDDD